MADRDETPKRRLPLAGDAPRPGNAQKRHLKVLRDDEVADEGDLERPPWHWSAIGVIAIFLAWLPLASLAGALVKRALAEGADPSAGARLAIGGLHAGAFALAAFLGGLLVGRFGARAGRKEAAVSGLVTAMIAWLLALTSSPGAAPLFWALLLLAATAIGAGAAWLGGRLGVRLR